MNSDPSPFLISVTFAHKYESVNSTRYLWDSRYRGEEPFVILQWTFEGAGEFTFQGKTWLINTGDIFIAIPPEESVYAFPKQATEPWRYGWLNLYGAFGVALARAFRDAFGPVVPLPLHSVAAGMLRRLLEGVQERTFTDSYQSSADFYAFLMEWTRQLTHPTQADRDPVQTAQAICQSRFREPLGIKELAAETGLTREHLSRLFSARTGISPGRYLRQLRVNAARQMLKERNLLLKEVALRCGFPSVRSLQQALAGETEATDRAS